MLLNADMGEVAANWQRDQKLLQYLDLVNISCGYHAGEEDLIKQTISLSHELGDLIGAHPGLNDRENFGRIPKVLDINEFKDLVWEQLQLFQNWLHNTTNSPVHHIKLHGALYHMVSESEDLSMAYLELIRAFDPEMIAVVPTYGFTEKLFRAHQQSILLEAFVDRRYTDQGTLLERTHVSALLEEPTEAFDQYHSLVESQSVMSYSGKQIHLRADTICIHGDQANALAICELIAKANR